MRDSLRRRGSESFWQYSFQPHGSMVPSYVLTACCGGMAPAPFQADQPPPPARSLCSSVQEITLDWVESNRSKLEPKTRAGPSGMLASMLYMGAFDLRAPHGSPLTEYLAGIDLRYTGPIWLAVDYDDVIHARRLWLVRVLGHFGFPSDFIEAEINEFALKSIPGGLLHGQDILVVACGDRPPKVDESFVHSIMILPF